MPDTDLCVKLKDIELKNFKCQCGCGGIKLHSAIFLFAVELFRRHREKITKISSVYRCKKHNSDTPGSSPTSKHLDGRAIDFHFDVKDHDLLGAITELVSDMGLYHINYSWGLHVDCRDLPDDNYDISKYLFENRLAK